MRVAIIGAGLSGLSLALKLLQAGRCHVCLFDPKGIGGGASGVASGLMHPYTGEQCRRSRYASEGIAATRELLREVEDEIGAPIARYTGIVRTAQNEAQRIAFEKHAVDYGDVDPLGGGSFLIRSGITIHCSRYLAGLGQLIFKRGGILKKVKVDCLSELNDFDAVVIAAGAGTVGFSECSSLRVKLIKGQVLTAAAPEGFANLKQSLIGKGYLALGEGEGNYYLGSTYEKKFDDDMPDLNAAREAIVPKIAGFFPEVEQFTLGECKAGVRVARLDHYLPIARRLDHKNWVLTALGSRGLLYHAFLAGHLAGSLLTDFSSSFGIYPLSNNGLLS